MLFSLNSDVDCDAVINVHAATPTGGTPIKVQTQGKPGENNEDEEWSDGKQNIKEGETNVSTCWTEACGQQCSSSHCPLCDVFMEKLALAPIWIMCLGWTENIHPPFSMLKELERNIESSAA